MCKITVLLVTVFSVRNFRYTPALYSSNISSKTVVVNTTVINGGLYHETSISLTISDLKHR